VRSRGNGRPSAYIGTRIPAILEARGIKQTWLAARIGISPEHLNRVLRGHAVITMEVVAGCTSALGLPADVLFTRPSMSEITPVESEVA